MYEYPDGTGGRHDGESGPASSRRGIGWVVGPPWPGPRSGPRGARTTRPPSACRSVDADLGRRRRSAWPSGRSCGRFSPTRARGRRPNSPERDPS